MHDKDMLSQSDVADLLDLPLVTIQRWEHQGKIPYKLIKHEKWYRRREIVEWAHLHDMMIREEVGKKSTGSAAILKQAIERGGIYPDINGKDILTVFQKALEQLAFIKPSHREQVLSGLLDREEMASTGIGNGVAIPHTRERLDLGLRGIYIPVFFLESPIAFNAIDGRPVFVLFMIFTTNTGDHLKILSRISYILKHRDIQAILTEEDQRDSLLSRITEVEQTIKK